jgi:hypothetical protein
MLERASYRLPAAEPDASDACDSHAGGRTARVVLGHCPALFIAHTLSPYPQEVAHAKDPPQ